MMLSFQEACVCTKPRFSFMVRFSQVSGILVQNDWISFPVHFCPPTWMLPMQAASGSLVWSCTSNLVVGSCCLQFPKGRVLRAEQYHIQGTHRQCSGLNKLLILLCLTSPTKGGLSCPVDASAMSRVMWWKDTACLQAI